MVAPPLDAGVVNEMEACPFPGVTAVIVGAPGTVMGVTLAVAEAGPVPAELVAVTEQLYVVPLVSPVTVIGDAEPDALNAPQVAV